MRTGVPMKYVLIAEDDPEIARLIADEIGERLYVATHVVANGALVPDAVAARRPDLLILDVTLPGLSGLDVFQLVRSDPQWAGVPVLFLTGSPDAAVSVAAAGETGVHQVMAKPFDTDVLVRVTDGMLDGTLGAPGASAVIAA